MNKRQRERLNSLANFIEKNPNLYDQTVTNMCIVGLGVRLNRGKLNSSYFSTLGDVEDFAAKFGMSYETAHNIWLGHWSRVNKKTKDARRTIDYWGWSDSVVVEVPARRAALFLRQVAKNHA